VLKFRNSIKIKGAKGGFMLSQIPVDFTKVKKNDLNKEILRAAIIAELDAINLYEQMAALTDDKDIKAVLLDIAREEKTHVGEFETLLLRLDAEQVKEMEHAKKEIKELTGK
jgi:rubrerythrin